MSIKQQGLIGIHPTADVSPMAQVGEGSQIWNLAQVREGSCIGRNCILGKGVYIDHDVQIGDHCKLQNGAYIFHGATLEEGVFVGPGAILTNDRLPRAINPDGTLKTNTDWTIGQIHVQRGASLGAGCIILPDVTIGEFALIGAGAVVTRNVPSHGLVVGNPARLVGCVCACGRPLAHQNHVDHQDQFQCIHCDRTYTFASSMFILEMISS